MNRFIKKTYSPLNSVGFTLMELLVVVLIIGILAAVALPEYQKAVFKSRVAAAMPLAKALKDAQDRYYMANGVWATDPADLDITLPKNCTVKFWDKASDRTHMQCPGVEYVFREDGGRWAQVLLVINPQPSGVQKIRFVFPYAASSMHSCYQPYQEPYCEAWGSESQYKDQQFCKMFSRPNEKKKVTCGEDWYVLPL